MIHRLVGNGRRSPARGREESVGGGGNSIATTPAHFFRAPTPAACTVCGTQIAATSDSEKIAFPPLSRAGIQSMAPSRPPSDDIGNDSTITPDEHANYIGQYGYVHLEAVQALDRRRES